MFTQKRTLIDMCNLDLWDSWEEVASLERRVRVKSGGAGRWVVRLTRTMGSPPATILSPDCGCLEKCLARLDSSEVIQDIVESLVGNKRGPASQNI